MSRLPPIDLPERTCQPAVGPLGIILILACLASVFGCENPTPSGSDTASPSAAAGTPAASPAEPTPAATGATQAGDVDGLVVLTGGALSMGTPAGAFVRLDGPGGEVTGFSSASGRVIARTAEPAFAIADVDPTGSSPAVWRVVEAPAPEIRHSLAAPALSHRGNLAAFAVADPGTNESFQIVVIDLANGDRRMTPLDRRANGPPVWIDDASVLVEVLPIPGGTPFLRLDPATGAVKPVAADGYGPAISGDGSVLALASTDGSVLAVPTAGWLAGTLPDEGAVVDASGSPFQLAVDASGRRLAIGYADAAGDPASIAIFVREGEGWRRSAARVQVAAGTVTMLGWLN